MRTTTTKHPTSGEPLELKTFDGIGEIIDYADNDKLAIMADPARAGWVGRRFRSVDKLRAEACEVWSAGLDMFDAARAKLAAHTMPTPATRRRRARFDEFGGDEICVDRLRSGAPFWRTTTRASVAGPTTITIAVDVCAPALRESDEIVWRGIAAVALTELLESAGYRVELAAYDYGRRSYVDGHGNLTVTTLKTASEPLDVASLVAATSGWFFRTFGLATVARSSRGVDTEPGLGSATHLTAGELAAVTGRPVDVVIDGVWDECAAVDLVENVLGRIARGELAAVAA